MRLLHISDPHFGALNSPAADAFKNSVEQLKPDLMVLTGDITQRARPSQFIAAKKYFSQFTPIPVLATPGNHDLPLFNPLSRFLFPFHEYKKYFSYEIETQFAQKGIEILILNSARPRNHIDGSFKIKDLEASLAQYSPEAKIRLLAFHHPLDCPKGVDVKNIIGQSEDVLQLCEKYRVDLVLNGHIHDPIARLSTIRYPQFQRPIILTVAGTCLSYRTRPNAPNSFHCLDLSVDTNKSQKQITVARYDLQHQERFTIKSSNTFSQSSLDHWQHFET